MEFKENHGCALMLLKVAHFLPKQPAQQKTAMDHLFGNVSQNLKKPYCNIFIFFLSKNDLPKYPQIIVTPQDIKLFHVITDIAKETSGFNSSSYHYLHNTVLEKNLLLEVF